MAPRTEPPSTPAEPSSAAPPADGFGRQFFAGYSAEPRPLAAYAGLVGLYNLAFLVFVAAAKASGRSLPERLALGDILLVGVATFKLSRLLAKDVVTSPLRAPFTTFERLSGEGEVTEKPRGQGVQRALGELVSCPFCMGTWVAAFLAYALVLSPPLGRLVAGIYSAHALADFLQLAYGAAAVSERKLEKNGSGPR